MKLKLIYTIFGLYLFLGIMSVLSGFKSDEPALPAMVKIVFRNVGDQLLRVNKDSTSLVLPVEEQSTTTYKLSFEAELEILPDTLVSIISAGFKRAELPENYRVEVRSCSSKEVVYSYLVKAQAHRSIIPCAERKLPKSCYTITISFTGNAMGFLSPPVIIPSLFVVGFGLFLMVYRAKKKESEEEIEAEDTSDEFISIGRLQYFPQQYKLRAGEELYALSKKECELLNIFVSRPNEIIQREELRKRVWEDNGVYVGRSLDTYVSKLRKKMRYDERIKLSNAHGIGYCLEIEPTQDKEK